MIIHVKMIRQTVNQENEITHPYFRSETTHILRVHDKDLEHNINSSFQKMFKSLDEFIRKGSSWSLKKSKSWKFTQHLSMQSVVNQICHYLIS
jgi:hypothetical protein